ncbi:MAG: MFS transporter [Myxococcota bacterium]
MAESEAVRSKRLPRAVVALGFVSLFMDVSSEMIHAALPLFLTVSLGASALAVGLIEGIAEATASITKVFAGVASDWLGRRKPFALLGYGLAALSKPLFPLATGVPTVLLARFTDRIGKGIRGAPRDALVADLTPEPQRGAAYGLRQALDTVGAMLGPALALVLLAATADDYRFVFWVAVAPAFVAVALLAWGVREPERPPRTGPLRSPIRRTELARLSRRYWGVVAFGAVLTLARFSEAFLVLRAADVGLAAAYAPLAMVVMNAGYAATAYPFGRLSDRGRRPVAVLGVACLLAADLVLAFAASPALALGGAVLWGVHMGATQGLLSAVVADSAPADLRGTAFGLFNLVVGITQLAASLLAGALWSAVGPEATFAAGAVFSTTALVGLLGVRRERP